MTAPSPVPASVAPPPVTPVSLVGAFLRVLSSVKLTVLLLLASIWLVFFATLTQVELGIYLMTEAYFKSWATIWSYPRTWVGGDFLGPWLRLPVPGGYLVGGLLLVNLILAHFRYFRPRWKKGGIVFIHAGLAILIISQGVTQLQQEDHFLEVSEGDRRGYLESFTDNELVVIDRSHPSQDQVAAIHQRHLREGETYTLPGFPFAVRVDRYFLNAAVEPRASYPVDWQPRTTPPVTQGLGAERDLAALPWARTTRQNTRDRTVAIVTLSNPDKGSLGTWLLANDMAERYGRQRFTVDGKEFEILLRVRRTYLPFALELVDFRHDRYPGTEIPRNFSSDVIVRDGQGQLISESRIFMNNPLRYGDWAFYQASFKNDDTTSIFQVVRNPGWLGPYVGVAAVTFGLCWQFGLGLWSATQKRRHPKAPAPSA